MKDKSIYFKGKLYKFGESDEITSHFVYLVSKIKYPLHPPYGNYKYNIYTTLKIK